MQDFNFSLDNDFINRTITEFESGESLSLSEVEKEKKIVELVTTLIIPKLKEILLNHFGADSEKSILNLRENRINMACPICDDSSNKENKKRGNLYLSNLNYKCFNCGKYLNIKDFISRFANLDTNETYDLEFILKNIKDHENLINSVFFDFFNIERFTNLSVSVKDFREKLGLIDIKGTVAYDYLRNRGQKRFQYFLYCPKYNQIFIMNMIGKDKLISYTVRNLSDWAIKKYGRYIINPIGKLYEDMELTIPTEEDDNYSDYKELSRYSEIFNFFNTNFTKQVTIFEGALDSLLMNNSIAIEGANKAMPIDIDNVRYFLDNDETGKRNSLAQLEKGKTVFLWNLFLQENKINTIVKDLSDLVKQKDFKFYSFDKYFSNLILDGFYI